MYISTKKTSRHSTKNASRHSKKNVSRHSKTNVSRHNNNTRLIPLYNMTYNNINELELITRDKNIMKYIGKGNIWSKKDIKQFIKDEKIEKAKTREQRLYYSFVLIYNNTVIGFISGRKKTQLLPDNGTIYDLLLRMFISNKYKGRGFGKLIIKLFIKMYSQVILNVIKTHDIKLISDIDKDNISSIKIHLANDFKYINTIKYPNKHNYDRYIYTML